MKKKTKQNKWDTCRTGVWPMFGLIAAAALPGEPTAPEYHHWAAAAAAAAEPGGPNMPAAFVR